MSWLLILEALAAIYLVGMSVIIDANSNWQSQILFKAIPMFLGMPMAFAVLAQLRGWPL